MFSGHDFLWSILVPGLVALAIRLAGAALKLRAWPAAALGLAFLAAFPAINFGAWRFPAIVPADSAGWLPYVAVFAMVFGIADGSLRWPQPMRALTLVIVAAIGLWLELKFKFNADWTGPHGAIIITAFALLAGIWWDALEDLSSSAIVLPPLQMWLIASCAAVVLMLIGPVTYGKFSLTLASGSFAMLPALLWRRSHGALRGIAAVFAILLVSLLAGGYYLSSLSTVVLTILATTPLFIWPCRWVPARWKPWRRGMLRLLITLVPLATALVLAGIQFQREQRGGENAYYSE